MEPKEEEGRKRAVFISHRHADKKIADAIRNTLQEWGRGDISIFQSTDPESGPGIGAPLDEELKAALFSTSVVLLVYTFTNQDWSYPMWECGVATDVERETKIVVFQCTNDDPKLFHHQVRVRVTDDVEIRKFTWQFHKDPKFFPGFDEAFAPSIQESALDSISDTLYERLIKVIPAKKLEPVYRWDFLTLELDSTHVKEIQDESSESVSKLAADIIPKNCVVKKAFGAASRHFGLAKVEEGKKFAELVESWERNAEDSSKKWVVELYAEMMRAIRYESAVPAWELFKSVLPDTEWWFYPVINHVRVFHDDRMEFDLYLYRIPTDIATTSRETAT